MDNYNLRMRITVRHGRTILVAIFAYVFFPVCLTVLAYITYDCMYGQAELYVDNNNIGVTIVCTHSAIHLDIFVVVMFAGTTFDLYMRTHIRLD